MTKRILLGGVVGGIVMFLWGALSHMVLGLGETGIKELPNEEAVIAAMRAATREPGFYFFPGREESPGMTKEQQQAAMQKWEAKYREGPTGILIYHPQGEQPLSPKQLLRQVGFNIMSGLLAAFLLSKALGGLPGFGGRVLFVTLLGLFGSLIVNFPYWNWYRFPSNYTLAVLADQLISFCLAGLAIAPIVKRSAA